MSLSDTPPPHPATGALRLPLSIPRAMLAWLIRPAALVRVGLTPRRPGTGLAPNVVLMPAALIAGFVENMLLARLHLRSGAPVDLPMLGAFDLDEPLLAAACLALAEIAAFYLVALVPLLLVIRLFRLEGLDHLPTALSMRFAALCSLWLTALTALHHAGRDLLAQTLGDAASAAEVLVPALVIGLPGLIYILLAIRALRER